MFECTVNVPEIRKYIKNIVQAPGNLFHQLRIDVRKSVGDYISLLMEAELSLHIGRDRYERSKETQPNYRNGHYERNFTLKGIGEIQVRVPRDRAGTFQSAVLPKSKQYEDEFRQDLVLMFLSGVSTRSLAMISRHLLGRYISPSEISNASKQLTDAVERWRNRDLSDEAYKYLFLDGVNFRMRIRGNIELVPVLVVVGVSEIGHRKVLALQSGDKESATSWRQLFKDLKRRGLDGTRVTLGVMDGLSGLERVFKEEFSQAKVQRCQVHVARNVLAKVPKKMKKEVGDDLRSIFYASSKNKAMEFYQIFQKKWKKDIPSAVMCVSQNLDSCLQFFSFPEEEWVSLRTTNIIERLNKEFKRRTKPMEIVAGEQSTYLLLSFISLRMELHWRSNPIGKVRNNLPQFQEMAFKNFTQKS